MLERRLKDFPARSNELLAMQFQTSDVAPIEAAPKFVDGF